MVQVSRSARFYQDRREPQFPGTKRGPGPQVYLPDNPVNHLNLEPPALRTEPTCCPPTDVPAADTNRTEAWPYGDKYAI